MTLQVNRLTDDSGSGPPIFNYGFKLESNNSNWIHLKAPDALTANYTLNLPPSGSTLVAAPSVGSDFLVAPTGSVPVLLDTDGTIKHTGAPYFCAEHTANESPGANGTLVQWTVITNDGGGNFTSGVYTVPKAGRYLVTASLLRNSSTAVAGGIYLVINGSNANRIIFVGSNAQFIQGAGCFVQNFAVDDTISLKNEIAGVNWYGEAGGLGTFTITYLG